MKHGILRVGIAGLGGAGSQILPSFPELDGIELAAAADSRAEAREAFEAAYGRPAYPTVEGLCRSDEIDAVYVATPSSLHCEHTLEAVRAGKHVLCEKPLATRIEDCDRMIEAARRAGLLLIQGHSKVLEAPVRAMREVIASGRLGAVFQLDAWNFNDWMRRPRLASELDTDAGGGVVLRQAPPLVDLARFLVGQPPRSVRAVTGRHAVGLAAEGNFSALIAFDGGAAATLSFNGYGFFYIAGLISVAEAASVPPPRRFSPVTADEKYREPSIGGRAPTGGLTVVSGQHGVMVHSPLGLHVHTDRGREEIAMRNGAGRAAGLIELRDALREGRPGFPDGTWGGTTLEVCLAILESSRQGREISIGRQSRNSDT